MKVLIFIICFLPIAIIQTSLKMAGSVGLGAIPVLVLLSIALWCEKKLNAAWDRRKASKATSEHQDSPVTSPDILPEDPTSDVAPEPTIADPASPAPATPKLRYCKLCGAPIDPVTRKCTGCRKQYFRLPVLHKKHLYIGAGVLVCAVVVFLVFNLVFQKNTALSKVDQLTAQITELENTIAEKDRQIEIYKRNEEAYQVKLTKKGAEYDKLRTENTELKSEISAMNYEISFYDRHIVFVSDDGTKKYHNYSCEYLDLSYFWAYNVEAARDRGYKPCSHCCD